MPEESEAATLSEGRRRESDLAAGLARLLKPRSIAVAGASADPATMGGVILANCDRFGFAGDVHLISPTRDAIGGRPCIRSVDDLPIGVDALVLNVPRAAILPAVEAAARRGVGGVIVFASGFAEAGGEGQREQEAIAHICRGAGMALLGPNCMGYVNYADGVALTFEPVQPQPLCGRRSVAVIAQSGATASGIRSGMQGRGIAVALQAAIGNEAVVRASDLIDRVVVEGKVDAIGLYVEQIRDPAAFLAAARRAREAGIPVVMMHPGRSKRGQQAAQSHTGSMVGDYALMRTAVENEAVVAVNTMDELFDALAILHRYPLAARGDLGIVTNSGAIRGMAFDFAEDIGLPIAEISGLTLERLGALLPAGMEIDNPLDVGTTGFAKGDVFGLATAAMLADPAVSGVLLPMAGGGPAQQRAKAEAIIPKALGSAKPVAVAITGDESVLDTEFVAAMRASETPLFRSPERAMRAFAAVRRYAGALHAIDDRTPPAAGLARWAETGVKPEYQGKEFLRSIGVRVPAGALAGTVDEGIAIATRIGFPIVLKAQAAALSHKSDVGGVALNLRDANELRAAWALMFARLGDIALDGVLVEQMSPPGLELVVGARNHPEWGPSVLIGLGGVLIEALDAAELLPADISHSRAVARIRGLRGAKLLGAFRGRPLRDVEAAADVVVKVGAAMRAGIGIEEIDINPLMVLAQGEGAIALDALIVTGA
ncbi:acetate--CoA ligase family protein [Sphingomonas psychrotolerans]|uniref:Acetate--CoA ligase family protein n=1 Tax=Sphingomonas psychrotolerans TaxID=1327635 RepID=A0ABU3N7D8_9SPHN|nr:acetate--CoA ligase family protein [Sphingomonas psychrotolerans]MDT8760181.1 acetate--CoA ligase family protein [Sphingomonas psychrotolerans]